MYDTETVFFYCFRKSKNSYEKNFCLMFLYVRLRQVGALEMNKKKMHTLKYFR